MQEPIASKGVIRLHFKIRFDLPFSLDESMPVKEIVRNLVDEHDFQELAKLGKGSYAEEIRAILVDMEREKGIEGMPRYETISYDTADKINELIYERYFKKKRH